MAVPTKREFSEQLNRVFTAHTPDRHEFELVLTEFIDVLESDTQETFTLLFKAPNDVPPLQMTYRLTNDEMGDQEVFLVPVRQDAEGTYFEAVYNRSKAQLQE